MKEQRIFNCLQDLTGQEAGIVIYKNNDMIICNWSSVRGIPRVFCGFCIIGLDDVMTLKDEPEEISDILEFLFNEYGEGSLELLWDIHGDINNLEGSSGALYKLGDGIVVIAPHDWN